MLKIFDTNSAITGVTIDVYYNFKTYTFSNLTITQSMVNSVDGFDIMFSSTYHIQKFKRLYKKLYRSSKATYQIRYEGERIIDQTLSEDGEYVKFVTEGIIIPNGRTCLTLKIPDFETFYNSL